MNLLLGIILIVIALSLGYIVGDVIGFRTGWDKGRDYCIKWYDPHQYEWEKRFNAQLRGPLCKEEIIKLHKQNFEE